MIVKDIVDYDISNYHLPSMFIIFPYCTFKCNKDCSMEVCQNYKLLDEPNIEINPKDLIQRYLDNPLTYAVVCGGLEPFDSKEDLYDFISAFRKVSQDIIIIYTGYNEKELKDEIPIIKQFDNIIVKYGRFFPNGVQRYDSNLGKMLASNNQYSVMYFNNGSEYDSRKLFKI